MSDAESKDLAPEELIDEITVSMVDGVGSLTFQRLLDYFGDCGSILSASVDELQAVGGIGPKLAEKIASARESCSPYSLIELCRREKIDLISYRDRRYPPLLKTIHDPPPILYVQGTLLEQDALSLAVVGTLQMTAYGQRMTVRLTRGLTQYGLTVVSGLAKGVDGVAHGTALDSGGRTLAVLGSGLLRLYPKEHATLAERIKENGALISEFHPLMEPSKGTFPQRNRIVVGLSLGVLVVEAPRKSGTMITARLAGESSREVFAVPGRADEESSRGCNQLIRDGARPVETVDDVLASIGSLITPVVHPDYRSRLRHGGELQLNDVEERVLNAVGSGATPLVRIVETAELLHHQVVAALVVLEERGLIRRFEEPIAFARIE